MKTGTLLRIEHEELIKEEARKRFPSLDPNWVACRWLDEMHENAQKTAEILALMAPEIRRVMKTEQEKTNV